MMGYTDAFKAVQKIFPLWYTSESLLFRAGTFFWNPFLWQFLQSGNIKHGIYVDLIKKYEKNKRRIVTQI